MTPPSEWFALTCYCRALELLDGSAPLNAKHALDILRARDELQSIMSSVSSISTEKAYRIQSLDAKLKKHAAHIDSSINLARYRETVHQLPKGWWWYLDKERPRHRLDRYDWLLKGLTFGLWTISTAFLVNLSSRFLSGGPDIGGTLAIVIPSLVALLTARSELTEAGAKGFDRLLQHTRVPNTLRVEAKFLCALIFLIALLLFWQQLPRVSDFYDQLGFDHYRAGELSSAEKNYKRAIALAPDNSQAHFNLGSLYEDWLRFEEAEQAYQVAISGRVFRAHNNLARLYILEGNYSRAVSLLTKGEQLVKEQLTLNENFRSISPEDQYSLMKNLGWVRFKQDWNEKAIDFLNVAISISHSPEIDEDLFNRASAHCILAQVLEEEQRKKEAYQQWELCSQLGNSAIPEEDAWLNLASQYLQNVPE